MRLNLSAKQCTALARALRSAYSRPALAQFLKAETRHELDAMTVSSAADGLVFASVIQRAEQMGWSDRLVLGASAQRGDDPLLAACLFEMGLSAASPARLTADTGASGLRGTDDPIHALRRAVKLEPSFISFDHFLARLGELDAQICRIEWRGSSVGAGLLVADDLVLTSAAVQATIGRQPAVARCRFDYRALPASTSIRPGQAVALARDQPGGACGTDPVAAADDGLPPPSSSPLDFALLRLASPVGRYPPGLDRESSQTRRRGFAPLRVAASARPGREILVVAHGDGGATSLALGLLAPSDGAQPLGPDAPLGRLGGAGWRGAPCFNPRLELVGVLSVGSMPGAAATGTLVSIEAIVDRLAARGQLPAAQAGEPARVN